MHVSITENKGPSLPVLIVNSNDNATGAWISTNTVPHTSGSRGSWNVNNGSAIYMYTHDKRNKSPYTQTEFSHVIAHEFGHVLGIDDAYSVPDYHPEAIETYEVRRNATETNKSGWLRGEMMRNNGNVSSNTIEMMLEAWKTNEWQSFTDYFDGSIKKSKVVRLT